MANGPALSDSRSVLYNKGMKKLTASQLIGQRGEFLVAERAMAIGFAFDVRSRLETGVDGMLELHGGDRSRQQHMPDRRSRRVAGGRRHRSRSGLPANAQGQPNSRCAA